MKIYLGNESMHGIIAVPVSNPQPVHREFRWQYAHQIRDSPVKPLGWVYFWTVESNDNQCKKCFLARKNNNVEIVLNLLCLYVIQRTLLFSLHLWAHLPWKFHFHHHLPEIMFANHVSHLSWIARASWIPSMVDKAETSCQWEHLSVEVSTRGTDEMCIEATHLLCTFDKEGR